MSELLKWRHSFPNGPRTMTWAAKRFGISLSLYYRYESGQRKVAATRAIDFERITGISRHVLRPDIFGPQPNNDKQARTSRAKAA